MGMAALERSDWTVAEVQALPDDGNRYEIVDGVLYVTPSPLLPHQLVLSRLHYRLMAYADPLGFEVLESPADIVFSDRTLVQPDLFVYPRRLDRLVSRFADIGRLTLVVEVLSKSTARRDRSSKRRLYQEQGVSEYWIVDGEARSVERWRPESAAGEMVTENLHWQPRPAHAPLVIDLPAMFREALG